MSYQSPLHIIKGLATEPDFKLTDVNLIRLRKQLFAELNLSGETTITVNKKQYSKDEIIKTIDVLLSNPDIELHEFIFNQPFLLNYLEDETLQLNSNLYKNSVLPDTVKNKLEGIIYERFITQFKKGLSTRQYSQAEGAVLLMITLSEHYKNECFETVHQSLYTFSNFIHEIEINIKEGKFDTKYVKNILKEDLKCLAYPSLAILLNALPVEFEEVKEDIVIRLINLTVAYHQLKNNSNDVTKGISNVLIKINSPEHSTLIRSNHKAFVSGNNSSSSSGDYDIFNWLRVIGFLVFLSISIFRSCDNNSSTNFKTNNYTSYSGLSNTNSFNNINSSTLHVDNQISNLRQRISDKFILKQADFSSVYDTLKLQNGDNPFHNQLFYVKDSTFKTWQHSLNIVNKTKYDVIVMYYDSSKTNFISTYIKSGAKSKLTINTKINLIFYFGNTLLAVKISNLNKVSEVTHMVTMFPEYFKETTTQNINLFNKTFQLDLKKEHSKKLKPLTYDLVLDSAFIADTKDERAYNKFTLKDIDFIIK